MASANVTGYVTRYESSDGGSGDATKTVWQVFVGNKPVNTTNRHLAETVPLALLTDSQIDVTYDDGDGVVSQVRIRFNYCDSKTRILCSPNPV